MEPQSLRKLKNLDWDKLKSFYYVAKAGNISGAAQVLNITISPLSRQISMIEKQFGYPLFSRHRTGVTLTRRGKELFEIVENMFLNIKEFAYHTYDKNKKDKRRKIRISTTHAIAVYMINDLLSDYQDKNPHITFELSAHDKLIDIIVNDVDIAIRPYDSQSQGIEQELLFTLQKKLYASPEYIKNYGEPKTVEDLRKHRLIAPADPYDYPYSDVEWVLRLGMPEGKFLTPYYSSNAIECLMREAQKGHGIVGGYPKMSIISESNLINILPTIKDKIVEWYFVYPTYLKQDTDIITFKDSLKTKIVTY